MSVIKRGDVVSIKGQSVTMTVIGNPAPMGDLKVDSVPCIWFDTIHNIQKSNFACDLLVKKEPT